MCQHPAGPQGSQSRPNALAHLLGGPPKVGGVHFVVLPPILARVAACGAQQPGSGPHVAQQRSKLPRERAYGCRVQQSAWAGLAALLLVSGVCPANSVAVAAGGGCSPRLM